MSKIISLRGDAHTETQRLLPWFVNGTLDSEEEAAVEIHLAECAECRAELAAERALSAAVATMPVDLEQSFAALKAKIGAEPPPSLEIHSRNGGIGFFRRPITLGWAIAAQAAVVVLAVGAVSLPNHNPQPAYHALGAAPQAAAGNLLVIFKPDLTEREMQTLLIGMKARVVDGPSAGEAWVLRVDDASRPQALATLKADKRVLLAEPVDAGR